MVIGEDSASRNIEALNHFQQARRRAQLEQVLARLSGTSANLLPFDEVRQMLHGQDTTRRSLREVPLDAIVGSVGRYADFTRSFLPLRDEDKSRWTQVELQMTGLTGLPPIEVYQIGETYYARKQAPNDMAARQRCHQRLAAHSQRLVGGSYGPPGL